MTSQPVSPNAPWPKWLLPLLGWLSLAGLGLVGLIVFAFTPEEKYMRFSQKIMYLHVPSILATYTAFGVVFISSIGYLWKRTPGYDRVAKCSAEVGVVYCGLVLATGSIWAKPTWNTYWDWDPRLTTTLVLFMIFVGYTLLRSFAAPGEQQARLAAVLGIVGGLDIPIIHLSVSWWRALHQPSTLLKVGADGAPKPAMPPELLYPLLFGLVVALVFYLFLLLYRLRVEMESEALESRLADG